MDEIIRFIILIFSNATNILSLLLVVMISSVFLGRNVRLTRAHYLSSAGILGVILAANVVLNLVFKDTPDNSTLLILNFALEMLIYVYAFVFYLFVFKEKRILRAIESTVAFYLVTLYFATLAQLSFIYFMGGTEDIMNLLFYEDLAEGPYWIGMTGVSFILIAGLWAVVYFGFYRKHKQLILGIPYRIVFVIWVFLMNMIPFIPAEIPSEFITLEQRYSIMSLLFGIGTLLLGFVVPVAIIILTTERTLAEKTKYQESYLTAELEYIEQYKHKQTETRAFRHDIINNLSMTKMMLDEGHIEEAKEHISDMLGNVRALSPRYITGDEMLDLIVSMKADKMEDKNITFLTDGVIDGGLKIRPMDMCSIFANALDNAIEAASKCPDPSVRLSIKRTKTFFVIRISNSAMSKVDVGKLMSTSGYTTKRDTEHHGFGLLNIRTAVEKYDGMLKAESDDGSFSLSVMIPRTNG